MPWHAVNLVAFVCGLLFIIGDACVTSSQTSDHVQQTQSMLKRIPPASFKVETSSVSLMVGSSVEAVSPSFTSNNHYVKKSPPVLRPSAEIRSSRPSQSISPSTTRRTASISFPEEENNCTELLLEVKNLLEACVMTSKSRGHIPLSQSVSMINSRLTSSITPTSTTVIPSPTVSTNITNCTDEKPAQNKKLDAKKGNGEDPLNVKRGQLTFDAEGNDNEKSIYFSRMPHVPTDSSGITLGRGYDMLKKKEKQVLKDLQNIGIPKCKAKKFAKGVGLKGKKAKNYLKKNGIEKCLLTHEQQKKLFDITYKTEAAEAKRIATKRDVEKMYGETDWDKLNDAIKDVVVDLKYRGDYTPETRKKIQAAIASNDLKRLTELMCDRNYWVKKIRVPKDRFERRKAFLEKAKQ